MGQSFSFPAFEYVALAAIPDGSGDAILAYRDAATGGLYWAAYQGAQALWTSVIPFSSPTNVFPIYSPSITHGINGALATIAFVDSDTVAYSSQLVVNGTAVSWTAPVAITGPGQSAVAITAYP